MMYSCVEKSGAIRVMRTDTIAMLRYVNGSIEYIADGHTCHICTDCSKTTYDEIKSWVEATSHIWYHTIFEGTLNEVLVDLRKITSIQLAGSFITVWVCSERYLLQAPDDYSGADFREQFAKSEFNKLLRGVDEYLNSRP